MNENNETKYNPFENDVLSLIKTKTSSRILKKAIIPVFTPVSSYFALHRFSLPKQTASDDELRSLRSAIELSLEKAKRNRQEILISYDKIAYRSKSPVNNRKHLLPKVTPSAISRFIKINPKPSKKIKSNLKLNSLNNQKSGFKRKCHWKLSSKSGDSESETLRVNPKHPYLITLNI